MLNVDNVKNAGLFSKNGNARDTMMASDHHPMHLQCVFFFFHVIFFTNVDAPFLNVLTMWHNVQKRKHQEPTNLCVVQAMAWWAEASAAWKKKEKHWGKVLDSMFKMGSFKQHLNFEEVSSDSAVMEITMEITVLQLSDNLALNIT